MRHRLFDRPVNDIKQVVSPEHLAARPLCGGASWRELATPRRWIGIEVFGALKDKLALVCCKTCKLVFTNPRPSNESLAAFYAGDTYICHETSGPTSAGCRAAHALARIVKHVPPAAPRTLLDYGAGGGAFLAAAQSAGWQVHGFEPGRLGLEHCRNAGLDVTDKLTELAESTFGLVTFHHVFEHLTNPAETLGIVRQLLARNGRLYIEVPNAGSLRARLAMSFLSRHLQVDERYRAYPVHLIYYSTRTRQQMLRKIGWTVEATFTVGMGLDEFFIRRDISSGQATGAKKSTGGPLPAKTGFGINFGTLSSAPD